MPTQNDRPRKLRRATLQYCCRQCECHSGTLVLSVLVLFKLVQADLDWPDREHSSHLTSQPIDPTIVVGSEHVDVLVLVKVLSAQASHHDTDETG